MSRFEVKDTPIMGVKHVIRKPLGDPRGWLERLFCSEALATAGWTKPVVQINRTFTKEEGTVRGMHFQHPPQAECKFISCLHGAVWDVAVDLRQDSPTFLQHYAAELSAGNHASLLLPEGVAHGFQALCGDVEMLYLHSAAYAQAHEDSIHPEDPALKIDWPLPISVMSDRDKSKTFLSPNFQGIKL